MIFRDNYSKYVGGIIYAKSNNYMLFDNEELIFENNYGGNGGCFFCSSPSELYLIGRNHSVSRFINHSASTYGGVFCIMNLKFNISNFYFANNYAGAVGGTFY